MAFRRQLKVKLKPCLDCPVLVPTRCRRSRCAECQRGVWRAQARKRIAPFQESQAAIEAAYQSALAAIKAKRRAA